MVAAGRMQRLCPPVRPREAGRQVSKPSWFRREPDRTATGYRWLDTLTYPYWAVASWLAQRHMWRLLALRGESWRQARDRTRRFFREHPTLWP